MFGMIFSLLVLIDLIVVTECIQVMCPREA